MPLHEGGRGRADAHNQVERVFGKQGTQILDERSFSVFIVERAVTSEWSMMSSGQGDCRLSSARMDLAYSLHGLKSRPKE